MVNKSTILLHAKQKFAEIESVKDLKRNGLTGILSYEMVWYGLRDLLSGKYTETICKESMDWFKKQGFRVQEEGIGWKISL